MHTPSIKWLVPTLCLSVFPITSGCGTMVSHFHDCGGTPPPGVYRGTASDAAFIAAPFSGKPESAGFLPFGLIDLPFSFAADTVIFPFELADYIHRRKRKDETPLQPEQTAPTNSPHPQHEN